MATPVSDHFNGRTFFNPGVQLRNNLRRVLKWMWVRRGSTWPKHVARQATPAVAASVDPAELVATFISHATYLLQFSGLNVLTDPVFSTRIGPVSGVGPRRVADPGVALDDLPKIHLVVISHNHYDHLDLPSLKRLYKAHDPLFIVPLGNARYLKKFGVRKIQELDWWQTHPLSETSSVTLVPVQHWSARGLHDRMRALWGGYVLSVGGWKVYFAGDTGYGPHFKAAGERFGRFDLSLLPIGAYEPRWFMQIQHMDPAQAVQAHVDLRSTKSLGMHYGTFRLADEGIDDPPRALLAATQARPEFSEDTFRAPLIGETVRFHRDAALVDDTGEMKLWNAYTRVVARHNKTFARLAK